MNVHYYDFRPSVLTTNIFLEILMPMFRVIFCLLFFLVITLQACNEENPITSSNEEDEQECVVIVPDIQYYTNSEERIKYLDAIVDYCKERQDVISFLLQTGDITNNNQLWQWNNSYRHFFSQLPKSFPVISCLGNHDYGENGLSNERQSNVPAELTPDMDAVMPMSKWDNYLRYVTLENKTLAILSLEFAPRNAVLEWADSIIKQNANIPIFILTHAFLNNVGQLYDASNSQNDNLCSQKDYVLGKEYLNDSKEIFDKIIYNNPNVKLIICGHSLSKNYIECLVKKNVNNDNVYCIMVNYQHYKDGGAGNIGLLLHSQGYFKLKTFNVISRTSWGKNIPFELEI